MVEKPNAALISDPSISGGVQSTNGPDSLMIPMLSHMMTQQQSSSASSTLLADNALVGFLHEEKEKYVPLDAAASLIELLDGVILLYYVEAHRQLTKVQSLIHFFGI
jgi:hypothetical protein